MSKRFKKIALWLGIVLAIPLALYAGGFSLPTDNNGQTAQNAEFSGVLFYTLHSTTTAAEVFTGAGVVYGYSIDYQGTGVYIELRDTSTASTSDTGATTLVSRGYSHTAGVTGAGFVALPRPIAFTKGLSFNCSTSTCNATVYYNTK